MTDADRFQAIERDVKRIEAEIAGIRARLHDVAGKAGRASDLAERLDDIDKATDTLPWRVGQLEAREREAKSNVVAWTGIIIAVLSLAWGIWRGKP